MMRVGLYLGGTPDAWRHMGGTYQYTKSMLDAVRALPGDQFRPVIAFSHGEWHGVLGSSPEERLLVPLGPWTRAVEGLWTRARLPNRLWRALAGKLDPFARGLLNARCDVWIFPSQDRWAYRVPARTVGVIHDLNHRYQRRFPEVSENGEFERRERHYRQLRRWAAVVLVDSDLGRAQVIESYGDLGGEVVPLPFVAPDYIYRPSDAAAVREKYGLPDHFLFYPAQFWPHKNHRRLVRAVALARKTVPGLKLVLAGKKDKEYAACAGLVGELGLGDAVHFLGYVPDDDMAALYGLARGLVMPTFFGPTNIPPLEAFAVGCPVAVSGLAGMREQVGDAGLFFHPEREEDIAAIMERLWTDCDLRARLVQRGRARAAAWGPGDFARRVEEILCRLASGSWGCRL